MTTNYFEIGHDKKMNEIEKKRQELKDHPLQLLGFDLGVETTSQQKDKEFLKVLEFIYSRFNMYHFDTGSPINENYLRELNDLNDVIEELKKAVKTK